MSFHNKIEKGYDALHVMEQHLSSAPFFVGGSYSIADVALFAYTHVAEEGGFRLTHSQIFSAGLTAYLPKTDLLR